MICETAVVPAHWSLEVANVLAIAERRQRIRADDSTAFLELLTELAIEVDGQTTSRAFHDILTLARRHKLTAYDAAYLELAVRHQIPLASLDQELCQVAVSLGVEVLV
jgi:predicted nucleic acid-binding protein